MVEPGLTDDEFARVEETLGFEFADDHRAFLAGGVPVGDTWPNWRGEGRRSLSKRLQLPIEGVVFAVEWSEFWHDGWGRRPARMKDALRSAKYQLERVPRLVPVYSHHYVPAGRGTSGYPVLSVVRTDVVPVASNLTDYVAGVTERHEVLPVAFWSDLISR